MWGLVAVVSFAGLQPVQRTRSGDDLATGDALSKVAVEKLIRAWAEGRTLTVWPAGETAPTVSTSSSQTWKGRTFAPSWAFDGDHKTAWVENRKGPGLGEWLLVSWRDPPARLEALVVTPGFAKNAYMFAANSRPSRLDVALECPDQRRLETLELRDQRAAQLFALAKPWSLSEQCQIRWTVRAVYRGKRFQDTSIADIRLVLAP